MKKIVLLMMIFVGISSFTTAQDTCVFFLPPDALVNKEIKLKSTNGLFDMNLMVGVKWLEVDNKIQLIFDRKSVRGDDLLFLLFSMSKNIIPLKMAVDCKSRKKTLWSKLKSAETKYLQYYLFSNNLKINDYAECFKLLANNNEEEFIFDLNEPEDFTISLPGFLAVKSEKRPWYALSKRNKRLQFKTQPLYLAIQFEKKPVIDSCSMAEKVLPFIEYQKKILETDSEDLLEAKRNKNCLLFSLLKDKIRTAFVDNNSKCEKYTGCEAIALAIKDYNDAFEKIYKEECVSAAVAPVASGCTLTEVELSAFNSRLKNLQMKININKKDGKSTNEEFKEYEAIKKAVASRLNQDCIKRHRKTVEAFNSYCTNIESLY